MTITIKLNENTYLLLATLTRECIFLDKAHQSIQVLRLLISVGFESGWMSGESSRGTSACSPPTDPPTSQGFRASFGQLDSSFLLLLLLLLIS
jgi:hypothetical protein